MTRTGAQQKASGSNEAARKRASLRRLPPGRERAAALALTRPMPTDNARAAIGSSAVSPEPKANVPTRRLDVLATERSHGRISERAFRIGRIVETTFESAEGFAGSGYFRERVDTSPDYATSALHRIDQVKKIRELSSFIERMVGVVGLRLLRSILCHRLTFGQYAADRGRAGPRGAGTTADMFRWLLEDLAEVWDYEAARRSVA